MKKYFLLILLSFFLQRTSAQNCSCADNFSWLKKTMETNDAGFQYAIKQKGEEAYQKHTESYSKKVQSIRSKEECAEILLEWLRFFRNGHLWIGINNTQKQSIDSAKIIEQYKNWETFAFDEEEFSEYVSKIDQAGYEGIWTSPPYTVGVRKVENEYIGFIIEADGVYWRKSEVKFKIREENGKASATYYLKNHSLKRFDEVHLLGNNYLQLGFVIFKRKTPNFPFISSVERYFSFLTTDVPLFEKISENTAILRISSFSYSEKRLIDSIIEVNKNIITSTENLIIDLRNNGGGSDKSFQSILPLIYTNPIRTVGLEFLSTPLNNQRMAGFINNPDFSHEDKRWAENALKKLNENPGEFVNLDSTEVWVESFDTIFPYPENVGIIINERNGSTTEQFLLAAKQSKKVKLFGTTTMGVLDISNMHTVVSPCNDLMLAYALSKSLRIPEMPIDDIGIQPDFYIDKSIPKYEWIEFVENVLSE